MAEDFVKSLEHKNNTPATVEHTVSSRFNLSNRKMVLRGTVANDNVRKTKEKKAKDDKNGGGHFAPSRGGNDFFNYGHSSAGQSTKDIERMKPKSKGHGFAAVATPSIGSNGGHGRTKNKMISQPTSWEENDSKEPPRGEPLEDDRKNKEPLKKDKNEKIIEEIDIKSNEALHQWLPTPSPTYNSESPTVMVTSPPPTVMVTSPLPTVMETSSPTAVIDTSSPTVLVSSSPPTVFISDAPTVTDGDEATYLPTIILTVDPTAGTELPTVDVEKSAAITSTSATSTIKLTTTSSEEMLTSTVAVQEETSSMPFVSVTTSGFATRAPRGTTVSADEVVSTTNLPSMPTEEAAALETTQATTLSEFSTSASEPTVFVEKSEAVKATQATLLTEFSTSAAASTVSAGKDCTQELCEYNLSPDYLLQYQVNVPASTNVKKCKGCSVSMTLIYEGEAWVAFGFNSGDGKMIGTEAIL